MMNSPYPGLSAVAILWFIGVVTVVVALLGVAPVYLEARQNRNWREKLLDKVDPSKDSDLNMQLLRTAREPGEVRGFTRGLIALLIVALTSLSLAAAIFSAAPDAGDVRKNIVTALTTVLATLAGFYFGSRTTRGCPGSRGT